MAAAQLPSVYYKLPGVADLEKPNFYSMCDWYMNSYFSDFVNDSGPNFHLLPPIPSKIPPEPPESSSGAAKSLHSTKISKKQYDNFRTCQKSSIDEYNLVKWIQKHGTESQTPMFVFHGFKIDRKKWKLVQSIAHSELKSEDSLRELKKLLKEENWLDDTGDPKEIEIDVVTVDPTNGVIIWEVKSRKAETEVDESTPVQNKKLKTAGKQEIKSTKAESEVDENTLVQNEKLKTAGKQEMKSTKAETEVDKNTPVQNEKLKTARKQEMKSTKAETEVDENTPVQNENLKTAGKQEMNSTKAKTEVDENTRVQNEKLKTAGKQEMKSTKAETEVDENTPVQNKKLKTAGKQEMKSRKTETEVDESNPVQNKKLKTAGKQEMKSRKAETEVDESTPVQNKKLKTAGKQEMKSRKAETEVDESTPVQNKKLKTAGKQEMKSRKAETEVDESTPVQNKKLKTAAKQEIKSRKAETEVDENTPVQNKKLKTAGKQEMKSRKTETEVDESNPVQNKKLETAGKQLRRDVAIISWLSKSFASENISTSIKKVVVLPDDQITAEDDAKFREKRDYKILDCVLLSEYGKISHWFQTEIIGNDKSDMALKHSIYREILPVMVGLAATAVTLTRDKSLQASEDKEGVSFPDAIAKLDSEIDQQKLTRQSKQFTDILSTNKETKFSSLKGLEILFLTPQQQSVLECSSNGLKIVKGAAGSGKTILTILKILKLCAREPKKKFLIFCNSKYGRKHLDSLTKNGVKAKIHSYTQAIKLDFTELDSLPGFIQPECQVLIFNEIPNRDAYNSV